MGFDIALNAENKHCNATWICFGNYHLSLYFCRGSYFRTKPGAPLHSHTVCVQTLQPTESNIQQLH